MITEITQSNPSQSLIEHDILLQQLQLQQLIILGLVLLVILLIPVAIIMFKRQKQASTYWRSLFQEIEQVNQDVTFRNQTQEAIIASLRERMQTSAPTVEGDCLILKKGPACYYRQAP